VNNHKVYVEPEIQFYPEKKDCGQLDAHAILHEPVGEKSLFPLMKY
jgi:hypothetical protein